MSARSRATPWFGRRKPKPIQVVPGSAEVLRLLWFPPTETQWFLKVDDVMEPLADGMLLVRDEHRRAAADGSYSNLLASPPDPDATRRALAEIYERAVMGPSIAEQLAPMQERIDFACGCGMDFRYLENLEAHQRYSCPGAPPSPEGRATPPAACHKCGKPAQINDYDDAMGPPVCPACYTEAPEGRASAGEVPHVLDLGSDECSCGHERKDHGRGEHTCDFCECDGFEEAVDGGPSCATCAHPRAWHEADPETGEAPPMSVSTPQEDERFRVACASMDTNAGEPRNEAGPREESVSGMAKRLGVSEGSIRGVLGSMGYMAWHPDDIMAPDVAAEVSRRLAPTPHPAEGDGAKLDVAPGPWRWEDWTNQSGCWHLRDAAGDSVLRIGRPGLMPTIDLQALIADAWKLPALAAQVRELRDALANMTEERDMQQFHARDVTAERDAALRELRESMERRLTLTRNWERVCEEAGVHPDSPADDVVAAVAVQRRDLQEARGREGKLREKGGG